MRVFSQFTTVLTFFLCAQAFGGEFHWCQSLTSIDGRQLFSAHSPQFPEFYEKSAHVREDGTWLVNAPIEVVWQTFKTTPMKSVWNSKLIQYEFTMGPDGRSPVNESPDAAWPGLSQGMRFYMDIYGEPWGIVCNMGFGLEITEIQPERLIKFQYLDFSPAYGEQWLTFEPVGENETRIHWRTRYLGKDVVIDTAYMFYHREAVSSFMKSALALIQENASSANKSQ